MARGRAGQKRPPLAVWLYGRHVATLSEPQRFRYRLDFTTEALDEFGEGARILSLALPLARRGITDKDGSARPVGAFLEGLLPEGHLRSTVATVAGISTADAMGLLSVLGRECAGAVQFLPLEVVPGTGDVRMLDDAEVERLVVDLPTYRLPEGAALQASLAGIQDKVLLVARDSSWGWPGNGAASTHIVKPQPTHGALDQLVQSENWALTVARAAGLSAAETRMHRFGDRDAIVVTRYDRDASGRRLHQEDFCQALGLDPQAKYESSTEGDRLARLIAAVAPRSQDPTATRAALLAAVTFNIIIGNGDAHSKNYSVLIDERGRFSLAPLYDVAPVMFMNPNFGGTGHLIHQQSRIKDVTSEDLVAEATRWGLPASVARRTIDDVVQRIGHALATTTRPDGFDMVDRRIEEFWRRRAWLPDFSAPSSDPAAR